MKSAERVQAIQTLVTCIGSGTVHVQSLAEWAENLAKLAREEHADREASGCIGVGMMLAVRAGTGAVTR